MNQRFTIALFSVLILLFVINCSENFDGSKNTDDNDSTEIIDIITRDTVLKLEVYVLSGDSSIAGVKISFEDTSLVTDNKGYFSIEKDTIIMLEVFFEHTGYKKDTLSLLLSKDSVMFFELTPENTSVSDYYPVILNHTWKYHTLFKYNPFYYQDYITERKIIAYNNTQIVSELHKYGLLLKPGSDTIHIDTVYQVIETYGENGRVNSYHEIYRATLGYERLVLNRFMEEGLNEGKMDIVFHKPMSFKEYKSNDPISGTNCLYADDIAIWPYTSIWSWENNIYLSDTLGLIKLYLFYAGLASEYSFEIQLVDFYENQ